MDYDRSGGTSGWYVDRALRSERWFEFSSPLAGAQKFRVVLYTRGDEQPRTELEVRLPEYDKRFAKTVEEPELGLLSEPIDLVNNREGLGGRLLGVEILESDQQRWTVELRNTSSRPVTAGFSYPRSYLADSGGRRYPVLAAESAIDVKRKALKKILATGERSLHTFDFAAPMTSPGALWLVLEGHDGKLRWTPTAVDGLAFPEGFSRPRPASPKPADLAFTVDLGRTLEPCAKDLQCHLTAIFLRPKGMRWRFEFLNEGVRRHEITFDTGAVRLQDEHGNEYRVLGTGAEGGFGESLLPRLSTGLWLDFGAPIDGARSFKIELASELGVDPFRVSLPEYPAALSPRSSSLAKEQTEAPVPGGEGFALLEGEVSIETDVDGFRAKLVGIERLEGKSRLTVELFNGSGKSVDYSFDLERTQLSDGVTSSPSRVIRADINPDPLSVRRREVKTLPQGGKAVHWFEFAGPSPAAKRCFVTLETHGNSQVTFGLLQVELND
jgi:hypothetical protein